MKAVNLGGDADTVGAIYGQLAGAYYGFDAIPSKWIQGLAWNEKIDAVCNELIKNTSLEVNAPFVPTKIQLGLTQVQLKAVILMSV